MSGPARGPSCAWRLAFCGALVVFFCAGQARSQDAAEAARQEKARKAAEQQTPRHVYTDDDLKRKVILTPEDQARVEARKKQQDSARGEQDANAKPQPQDGTTATESLGEIARRYRHEKNEREAALASKKKFTPFPYSVPKDALAEPKTGPAPLTGVLPGLTGSQPEVVPAVPIAPRFWHPVARDPHRRISPFEPRPLLGRPAVVAPPAIPVAPSKLIEPLAPGRDMEGRVVVNPVSAGLKSVQVVRGQSWWSLAETYLGNGARWPELRQLNANAGGPPELLKLGSVVVVPANANAKPSPRNITVSKGDSLWSLAEHHLGRGSAWTCLASANPQVSDYTHLAIGIILQLPAGGLQGCSQQKTDLTRK